ncbi:dTMP kinase [Dermatophilaceae bacterium Soc4.6]
MTTTPASPTGFFLAFEGGDGAGKSTQVALLVAALRAAGRDVFVTRQPGGTPLGAALRELVLHGEHVVPRAEALIYAADKAQHVDTLVRPALAEGRVVVTDRYVDSSVAYQGAGRDLGADDVTRLQRWAVDDLLPDLTVVLDVTPEVGRARRVGRGEAAPDRLEAEGDAFHAAVREHFLVLAAADPGRYLVLDAGLGATALHTFVMERVTAAGVLG